MNVSLSVCEGKKAKVFTQSLAQCNQAKELMSSISKKL